LVGSACGGDDAPPDTGGGEGGADAGPPIAPPEIPWLDEGTPPIAPPNLVPCAEGWRELVEDDVTLCDPRPASGAADCDPGEAHFVGEPTCRSVSAACPAGDFADGLPTDGSVIYVLAGAAAGGDGSLAAPYDALSQVSWSSVSAGQTVAIGKGTYEGTLALRAGARVVGACTAETILTGLDAPVPTVISVTSAGEPAVVEGLSIRGAPQRGATVESGRGLRLEGVAIESATELGLLGRDVGTTLTLVDVLVRGTRRTSDRTGSGMQVTRGATMSATRVVLEQNDIVGLGVIAAGTTVMLEDVVVRETREAADTALGIVVQTGAQLDARRLLVEDTPGMGISIVDPGTSVTLEDAVIRSVGPRRDGQRGRGIQVVDGASLTASGLVVEQGREAGIVILAPGTIADLADVIIRDQQGREADGESGLAISVEGGAVATIARAVLVRNRSFGLQVLDADTLVTATDLVIADNQSRLGDSLVGRAINVDVGGRLEAARVRLEGNREAGITVGIAESTMTLTDAVIRDTLPEEGTGFFGRGIGAAEGARFVGTRLLVERTLDSAIIASGEGATMRLSDVVIRDTRHHEASGEGAGRGLTAQRGGHVEATRIVVEHSQEIGVYVSGATSDLVIVDGDIRATRENPVTLEGGRGIVVQVGAVLDGTRVRVAESREVGVSATANATVTLRDFFLAGVIESACDGGGCQAFDQGYGVASLTSNVQIEGFEIDGASTCGVFIALPPANLELSSGVVSGSRIGACVQIDGHDLSSLMNDVVYRDNDVNLDATSLPVPPALGSIDG